MGYYGFPEYISVAEKREKATKALAKLKKKNPAIEPVIIEGRTLAKNWWGKAWNKNLESYADYDNRIGRGKSYVRNHAVLNLKISKGKVEALVQGSGSRPYEVAIRIDALSGKNWEQVTALCNHRIDSLEQLIEGKFPRTWRFCSPRRSMDCFRLRKKSILTAVALTGPACASMSPRCCTGLGPDWT